MAELLAGNCKDEVLAIWQERILAGMSDEKCVKLVHALLKVGKKRRPSSPRIAVTLSVLRPAEIGALRVLMVDRVGNWTTLADDILRFLMRDAAGL